MTKKDLQKIIDTAKKLINTCTIISTPEPIDYYYESIDDMISSPGTCIYIDPINTEMLKQIDRSKINYYYLFNFKDYFEELDIDYFPDSIKLQDSLLYNVRQLTMLIVNLLYKGNFTEEEILGYSDLIICIDIKEKLQILEQDFIYKYRDAVENFAYNYDDPVLQSAIKFTVYDDKIERYMGSMILFEEFKKEYL